MSLADLSQSRQFMSCLNGKGRKQYWKQANDTSIKGELKVFGLAAIHHLEKQLKQKQTQEK